MIDWFRILTSILAFIYTVTLVLNAKRFVHYFQLESYQFSGYLRSVLRQWKLAFFPGTCIYLANILTWYFVLPRNNDLRVVLSLCTASVFSLLVNRITKTKNTKKPLVFTARIKRLVSILYIGLSALITLSYLGFPMVAPLFPIPILLPVLVIAAGILALPVEKIIFRYYFHDAQKRLEAHKELIKIGITGSFGKTSVKFILQTILSCKFNVLATPASFNTPMGVARIVRERLRPEHHVFISEMGARHVGDIKELCRLVHPSIGILTSIGPQHLQTFKTIDRIAKTKNELMESLPNCGFGVFSDDGAICLNLYVNCKKMKMLVGGIESDCWAEEVKVSQSGSVFVVCFKGGERINCETRLLGEHNVRNILLSCAVAKHLGLSDKQIKIGVSMLQPVEHRLQLLNTAENITVIDDAFNSNPHGSHVALNVLKQFPGRRIIVTPGMVELGEKESEYNHEFGLEMATCVNIALLIGKKHTKPIVDGLLEGQFTETDIHVMNDLGSATAYLKTNIRAGDVILYENDLPDHYDEH
jgi:UDP-N-acetylmuramoyl-tripeptide--D-alanyl-D-alanine ligase